MISRLMVSFLFLAAVSMAAQSASDLRFEIKGTVLDAQSGEPIPQALVTLFVQEQNSNGQQFLILADLTGGFQIRNIPAGMYRLQASRSGYFDANLPSLPAITTHNFVVQGIPVERRTDTVKLYLSRQAVLQGTAIDPRGLPIPGNVVAFRIVARQGKYQFETRAQVSIDPTGSFRITGLPPGKYYVGFFPTHTKASGGAPQFDAALYPGVSTVHGARVFDILPGREEEIHFRPSEKPSYAIRGTLPVRTAGFGWAFQSLENFGLSTLPSSHFWTHVDTISGTFSAYGLFPGQYVLTISDNTSSRYIMTVGAGDQDVELVPLAPIRGTIRIEEPMPQPVSPVASAPGNTPAKPPPISIAFQGTGSLRAKVEADHSFTIDSPLPGRYVSEITTMLPQYVKSIRQSGHDLLRDDLLVTTGSADPIEIVIGQGSAHATYSIANPAEAPPMVRLLALRNVGDRYRVEYRGNLTFGRNPIPGASPAPNTGTINGLPPGEYWFVAWNSEFGDFEQLPYNEEEFLKKYSTFGQRLTVYGAENLNLVLDPRLPREAFDLR